MTYQVAQRKSFVLLKPGQTFEYKDKIYLKLKKKVWVANCRAYRNIACISTGELAFIDDTTFVTIVVNV
jgi:hypothetical protein